MTSLEETSYENIKEMFQQFTPFYELWTTIDNWEANMKVWLNDDFLSIDPSKLEEDVDESSPAVNGSECLAR